MPRLKQFVYQYDGKLLRVPLARWQRILCLEQSEPAFSNCTIRIIYAYVEMANDKPIYCHRIEAVRYAFDEAGCCIPVILPDFDLISGVQNTKIAYLATRRQQRRFCETRYWEVTPLLLNCILDKIWSDTH